MRLGSHSVLTWETKCMLCSTGVGHSNLAADCNYQGQRDNCNRRCAVCQGKHNIPDWFILTHTKACTDDCHQVRCSVWFSTLHALSVSGVNQQSYSSIPTNFPQVFFTSEFPASSGQFSSDFARWWYSCLGWYCICPCLWALVYSPAASLVCIKRRV